MTNDQAHRILNRLRDGEDYPMWVIIKALTATGDLDGELAARMRSSGLVTPLPAVAPSPGTTLVAANRQTH